MHDEIIAFLLDEAERLISEAEKLAGLSPDAKPVDPFENNTILPTDDGRDVYRNVVFVNFLDSLSRINLDYNNPGVFHRWGNDFEELNSGVASITVAIVERPDGTIAKVLPGHLKFVEPIKL